MRTVETSQQRRVILAVDPSIAKPGAALFIVEGPRGRDRWAEAAVAFRSSYRIKTDKSASSVDRAARVGSWIASLVLAHDADVVVIEVPAESGSYHGRRRVQRSKSDINSAALELLNRAIGAAAHGARSMSAEVVELAPVDAATERLQGVLAGAINAASQVDKTLARDLVVTLGGEATVGKKVRHRVMGSLLRAAGHQLPKQEDARDAAWLGVQWIATEMT